MQSNGTALVSPKLSINFLTNFMHFRARPLSRTAPAPFWWFYNNSNIRLATYEYIHCMYTIILNVIEVPISFLPSLISPFASFHPSAVICPQPTKINAVFMHYARTFRFRGWMRGGKQIIRDAEWRGNWRDASLFVACARISCNYRSIVRRPIHWQTLLFHRYSGCSAGRLATSVQIVVVHPSVNRFGRGERYGGCPLFLVGRKIALEQFGASKNHPLTFFLWNRQNHTQPKGRIRDRPCPATIVIWHNVAGWLAAAGYSNGGHWHAIICVSTGNGTVAV